MTPRLVFLLQLLGDQPNAVFAILGAHKNDSNGMCEIGKIFGMNIIEMIKCFRSMENACGGCRAQPGLPSTKNLYLLSL